MKLIIFSVLAAMCVAKPLSQSLAVHGDGTYQFFYETGKEGGSHSRSESRGLDGVVIGKYSYEDPTGEVREVNYRADDSGYVAEGDVSVDGAPKGQFPATSDDLHEEITTTIAPPTEEPKSDEATVSQAEPEKREDNEAEPKELMLEEASEDAPPEGFPQGFFVQHFQGLRRLPEPTKVDASTTTEKPTVAQTESQPKQDDESLKVDDDVHSEMQGKEKLILNNKAPFFPLRPFPGFAHQEWASAMFREPVYVFSYQQPDSYGYHYFF